jgi:hypothetical protein
MSRFCLALSLFGVFLMAQTQSPQAQDKPKSESKAESKPEDLAGSRWEGTIIWGEKRSTRNRTVFQPYSLKVTFRFDADGTCNKGQTQPCKWEKDGNNVKLTLDRTKKLCQASASLVLNGKSMSGNWDHYGGFSCYLIPPQRQIKLERHD